MASRTDGLNVTAGEVSETPGVTVTDARFPTTLVHVRESLEQVKDLFPDLVVAYLEPGRRTVRIATPVRVHGRTAHRGGDVTYALQPEVGAAEVWTWCARTGGPVRVPVRQVAWLG